MELLSKYWQKAVLKSKQYLSSSRVRRLECELDAARDMNQSLQSEMASIETELDGIRSRDQEHIKVLEHRLEYIEAERETAHHQLQTLQSSLTEAITRLASAETRVSRLDTRLEKDNRKHQLEIEDARDRARRQERRLGWALVVAGFACLLGMVTGVTGIWDRQNNYRLLAELSMDIKGIKASMQQQLGSMHESLEDYRLSLLDEPTIGQYTEPHSTLAGEPERQTYRQGEEPVPTTSTYSFHPHNQYRSRSEMRAFIAENARELGVITLDSGLQYKVLSNGYGQSPGPADRVVIDYRILLADGTEVYSSYSETGPESYSVAEVIPGLREALQRMEEGARWELYVPPRLAHKGVRKRGRGKLAFEPVIYVVELKSVISS